jgi:hypothetical protein
MISQTLVVRRYTCSELLPVMCPEFSFSSALPFNIPPSTSIAAGTLMLPPTLSAVNDVQTVTVTNSPTGGTVTLTGTNPATGYVWTTAPIAYTFGDSAVASAINAVINGPSNTSSTPAYVTVASGAITYLGQLAGVPVPLVAIGTNALTGGTSPTLTITHTTNGARAGQASVYAGSSGSPTVIARYNMVTDANGYVWFANQTGGVYDGSVDVSASFFTRGYFNAAQLSILDSNAVTKLGARFIVGGLTAGPGSTPAGTLYIP